MQVTPVIPCVVASAAVDDRRRMVQALEQYEEIAREGGMGQRTLATMSFGRRFRKRCTHDCDRKLCIAWE